MNEERRCSDCKFDKEPDDFPNCKMCLDGGNGFEPIDKLNCDTCPFTSGVCDPCITKLQIDCTALKQELKALHDKNVELERQLAKVFKWHERLTGKYEKLMHRLDWAK